MKFSQKNKQLFWKTTVVVLIVFALYEIFGTIHQKFTALDDIPANLLREICFLVMVIIAAIVMKKLNPDEKRD